MKKHYHIFLVEDNPDHAILIREILLQIPNVHQVTLARDGQEALQYLSKARKVPDMMLLDLKLPRIDGFELLKILKSEPRWADLPVVAISTSDIKRDMQTALALGAEEYIVKPTNFQELYDRIATIVNRLAEKVSK